MSYGPRRIYVSCMAIFSYLAADVSRTLWWLKDSREAMVFGPCFERALSAYLEGQDRTAALFKE